ncbi:hypothetical protein [Zoogloea sp.]|uniref:hypothetical protein n=1 Tax=Zoogloea sp. TaxID=49181 RepID=UPI0014168EB2|nr:MAG: hypothetical protein F9K15_22130 [Zoogloea sp.]
MSPRMAQLLRRGEVLAVTAAPGGQRLVHLALVQLACGTEALGRFANDLSIAMMLGLFSAVGWSALVLARVPVAAAGQAAPVMFGLARGALLFTLLACLPLPLLAHLGWVFEPGWTALLLAGWTAYTLIRHFGLALGHYRILLVLETLLVAVLGTGLLGLGARHPVMAYAAFAVPAALLGLAGLLLLALRSRALGGAQALPQGSARTAAEQATLNLVSGGMSMILVPLTVQLAGERYGGLVALIGSLTSVLLLFPRALSFNALPALARALRQQGAAEARGLLEALRRSLFRVNSGLSVLAAIAWMAMANWGERPDFALAGASLIFLLQLASFYVGQMVLPEANYLQTVEETRLPLQVNLASLALFAVACGGVMLLLPRGAIAVQGLFAVLLGATLFRNLLLRRAVQRRAPEVFA